MLNQHTAQCPTTAIIARDPKIWNQHAVPCICLISNTAAIVNKLTYKTETLLIPSQPNKPNIKHDVRKVIMDRYFRTLTSDMFIVF